MSSAALAVAAAGLATVAWPPRPTPLLRLRALRTRTGEGSRAPAGRRLPTLLGAGMVTLLLAIAVGVPWWLPIGIAVGAGLRRVRRRPASADDLPLFADLLAACLGAGVAPGEAVRAATVAAPGRAGDLASVAAALQAGADARAAWSPFLGEAGLGAVARTCARAGVSGASAAADLRRVAARMRSRALAERQQRVARASIWVVLPVGLCFLPAFLLVGVVPVVVVLLGRVL